MSLLLLCLLCSSDHLSQSEKNSSIFSSVSSGYFCRNSCGTECSGYWKGVLFERAGTDTFASVSDVFLKVRKCYV